MALPALDVRQLNMPGVLAASQARETGRLNNRILATQANQAEREQAARMYLPGAMAGDPAAEKAYSAGSMEFATKLQEFKATASAEKQKEAARIGGLQARLAMSVLHADPVQQPMAYKAAREGAERAGLDISDWPLELNDETLMRLERVAVEGMTTEEFFKRSGVGEGPDYATLGVDQVRTKDGKVIGQGLPSSEVGTGPPTGPQVANNAEIDMARRTLDDLYAGQDPSTLKDKIRRATKELDSTGMPNPDYDPNVARMVRMALQKKVNTADPEFEQIYQRYFGSPPPGIPGGLGEGSPIVSQPPPDPNVILPSPAEGAIGGGATRGRPVPGATRSGTAPTPGGSARSPRSPDVRQRVPTKAGGGIDVGALEVGQVYEFADGSAAKYLGDEMFQAIE